MRKRVQGTEHEYTLYCRKMGTLGFDPHTLALDLLRESDLHLAGEFIKNGSRAYYDVGHFEISTCETSNPWDLVTWEKAGEKVLDWLRKVMEEKYTAGGVKIHAFKNNTSPDGTSYGSHENYCVSRDVAFPDRFVRELVPHLSTRFIYTGAGDIIDGKYVLSPMAYLTSSVVSGETMHDTGILNTRDEPHEDAPRMADPVRDMWHNVETRDPDEWEVHLDGGRTVSPIEIQRYYLGKIEPRAGTGGERRAFKLLESTLDGLEKKSSKDLARRVEWLDRYYAIQEETGGGGGPDVEMMACKQYSEI